MIRDRKTYRTCSELPLYNFIKIVVDDDLTWLYAEDKSILTRNIDLNALWMDIFSEYTELSNNPQNKHVFALKKELAIINNKLTVIQTSVNYLSQFYDKRLCDMLVKMGFRYKFTPESLAEDLKLTVSSAKKLLIRRKEVQAEYDGLNKSSGKATEDYFYGLIRDISRFNGFPIDPKKTNVTEFVKDINAFNLANTPKNGKPRKN